MKQPFSRRDFLNLIGAAGGSAAVYQSSIALGLIPAAGALSLTRLEPLHKTPRRVLILGAGISGLVCAYELERAGYECVVLEASHRIGGRNMTVRHGDTIDELGHAQTCHFDRHPNLYFNAGPARIPAHHKLLVHYCKTFQIPLEVFVNEDRNAWVQDSNAFGGKPVRIREYITDARGFIAEMLSKAVNRDEFDAPFSDLDKEKLLEFLHAFGDLNENNLYRGSIRAGYKTGGMVAHGTLKGTLDFSEILKSDFWRFRMHWAEQEDQAAPLMQAVGGMDNIVKGFTDRIRSPIITSAQVRGVTLQNNQVQVIYQHKGKLHSLNGDYCLNSIPKHLLTGIPNNFPNDYIEALGAVPRGKLFKIAFQMKQRFWEDDAIYGGISWTNQPIEQIWYPSHGIHSTKGIMLGAYTFDKKHGEYFERLTPAQRLEEAIRQAEHIHPDYRGYIESGVSVPWGRMNHLMGCNALWTDELRARYFNRLQQPEGRHYLIGDQVSYHAGWEEGAMSSAHFALADLNQRVQAELRGDAIP